MAFSTRNNGFLALTVVPQAFAVLGALAGACSSDDKAPPPPAVAEPAAAPLAPGSDVPQPPAEASGAAKTPGSLPNGLLLAYAQFEVKDGKALPNPQAARLEIVTRVDDQWKTEVVEDPESNVFHKAMTYTATDGKQSIATLGGMKAAVKLWNRQGGKWVAETLWSEKFGGKWDRMRDGEAGDVYGDGRPSLVIATHDQGVVAALHPDGKGKFEIKKLGARPDTFVHEIELGDLNGDGTLEAYATPSEPNKLEGGAQEGLVWRFVPKEGVGPEVAADLGKRHAKEILVSDVDGDGKDELYVAVEALTEGSGDGLRIVEPVAIRRYDADTKPSEGETVATLPDRLCRFLTAGDVDGDGKREMIAAAYRSGVWLLRPPAQAGGKWTVTNIERQSSGFEHAALLTDLDGDGKDELYVAADEQGELRRYTWVNGEAKRELIQRREFPSSMMTWNIMPVPVSLLGEGGK